MLFDLERFVSTMHGSETIEETALLVEILWSHGHLLVGALRTIEAVPVIKWATFSSWAES